jgi:hypothetical protein
MNPEHLSAARRAEIMLVVEWMREHADQLEKVAARATALQAEALMPTLVGSMFSMAMTLSQEAYALCAETLIPRVPEPQPSRVRHDLRHGNLPIPGHPSFK